MRATRAALQLATRLILCGVIMMVMAASADAQMLDSTPWMQSGVISSGAHFSGEIDTINLLSGNVTVNIPIAGPPNRDVPAGLNLTYNSGRWQSWWVTAGEGGYLDYRYSGGWRAGSGGYTETYLPEPASECSGTERTWLLTAVWEDPSGAKRLFRNDAAPGNCYVPYAEALLSSVDNDGSVAVWSYYAENTYVITAIQTRDGIVYEPEILGADIRIISRNSNTTTISGSEYSTPPGIEVSIVDALGRSYGWHVSGGTTGFQVTDSGGTPRLYEVQRTNPTATLACSGFFFYPEMPQPLVEYLDLPNGQRYAFEYAHSQRFLTKVTLPSGGYIAYVYDDNNESTVCGSGAITERRVSPDGTSQNEQVWHFVRAEGSVTVWSPESEAQTPTAGPVEHQFNEEGLESLVLWYAPDAQTVVKTVESVWDEDDVSSTGQAINPRRMSVTTIVGSDKQTVSTTYNSKGNVLTLTESDWYTGSTPIPLRQTVNTYVTRTGRHAAYEQLETSEVQRWDPELLTPDYVTEARTILYYDESGLVSRPGAPAVPWDRGNVTTIRRYKNNTEYVTETFAYDVFGNVVSQTVNRLTGVNYTTTFGYDDNYGGSYSGDPTYGFPTLITNAASHTVAAEYDYHTGLVTATTDAGNRTTVFTYDMLNRPDTIDAPGNFEVNYEYTGPTPLSSSTPTTVKEKVLVAAETERITETIFDKLGRPLQTILHDPAGNVKADTEYDGNGRVKRVSTPYRGSSPSDWVTSALDALNRPTVITNADSTTREFAYTAKTVTATDEAGVQRRQTFNGIGQMIRVDEINPSLQPSLQTLDNPLSTLYTYNASGALLSVCQYANSSGACPSGAQTRTFDVNWLGQVISEKHPESFDKNQSSPTPPPSFQYTYFNDGLLKTRTDARSVTTTYSYDALGRPTGVSYSDGTPGVSFAYDQYGYIGMLTSMLDGVGQVSLTYTPAGLLASETRQFIGVSMPVTSSYAYDYDGRLTEVTYPSGRVVAAQYAATSGVAADRLSALLMKHSAAATSWTTALNNIADNAVGQITTRTFGESTVETRTFTTRSQIETITATASSTTLLDLDYGYGSINTGRIRSRADGLNTAHSVGYDYDALGRLASVTNSNWNIVWGYDGYGNRTSQAVTGTGLSVSSFSRVFATDRNRMTDTEYLYDAAGNVTKAPFGGGEDFYAYDAENRLISVNTDEVVYKYDGMGRRVVRTTSAGSTYYVYGLTGLMSEFSTQNTGAQQAASDDLVRYIIPEHNGTPALIVDANGSNPKVNRRLPFGETFEDTEGSTNDQKFTTYDRDAATDLDYAMARWYASREGRFMSTDPGNAGVDLANPQTWNLYLYVGNDPINFIDPDGLKCAYLDNGAQYDDGVDVTCRAVFRTQQVTVTTSLWTDEELHAMESQLIRAGIDLHITAEDMRRDFEEGLHRVAEEFRDRDKPQIRAKRDDPKPTTITPPSGVGKAVLIMACFAGMDPDFAAPLQVGPNRPSGAPDGPDLNPLYLPQAKTRKGAETRPYNSPGVPRGPNAAIYFSGVGRCYANATTSWPGQSR